MLGIYKRLSLSIFGHVADRFSTNFMVLKPHLMKSGVGILLRTWVAIILTSVLLVYLASLAVMLTASMFIYIEFVTFFYMVVFVPIMLAAMTFMTFYLYPIQRAKSLERSIETDLPFALAHMSAIASSGIPPEFMFELLVSFEEYKAISVQAKMIVRNIKSYGMSSLSAMKDVAKRTPSASFKQVLNGMTSTIERGGDLVNYLKDMSDKSLFAYRIKRENYLKTLSTYADIYTALLVAAPLMLLAVLGVMSIIGGEIMGLTIQDIITLLTWLVLPLLNIVFLAFIHVTYPGV
ncbi:MAG: type II secretion system F family protein [Candidatus Aenigmarchaeota archaeon]